MRIDARDKSLGYLPNVKVFLDDVELRYCVWADDVLGEAYVYLVPLELRLDGTSGDEELAGVLLKGNVRFEMPKKIREYVEHYNHQQLLKGKNNEYTDFT